MNSTPRKIVQGFGLGEWLYVVCDDGTLWRTPDHDVTTSAYWQIVNGPPPLRKLEIERPRVDTNTPLENEDFSEGLLKPELPIGTLKEAYTFFFESGTHQNAARLICVKCQRQRTVTSYNQAYEFFAEDCKFTPWKELK